MRNKRSSSPMTLLDIIKNGFFQHVRFLVDQGVYLDQKDAERRTALMLCAFVEPENWGIGICRLLIENGANLAFKDRYGLNAFHYAVIYERVDLVRVYLKAIDFNLNEADKQGNTALHYAVKAGNSTLTRLIAQTYVKYRIDFGKTNNMGLTALQEADKLNKRKCARILDNPEVLGDVTHIDANIPLDLKSSELENDTCSMKSSRKMLSRPRSSILSYRSSKSSLLSSECSYRRSPTIYNYDTSRRYRPVRRDPAEEIPPNEKNNKNLIRCASISDIRNNAEHLFNMTPLDATVSDIPQTPPKRALRAKSAFVRRSEVENESTCSSMPRSSWRTEFRKLYVHFQYQCTPSYRETVPLDVWNDASLPVLDKPMTPANSEHALDEVDKGGRKSKVKSATVHRQNTEENLINAGKGGRQPVKSNSRKLPQNVGHSGKMSASMDGSLESSSESINSSASSKKQADGKMSSKPTKEIPAGRNSRASNHKNVPSVSVEEIQSNIGSETSSQDVSRLRVIDE